MQSKALDKSLFILIAAAFLSSSLIHSPKEYSRTLASTETPADMPEWLKLTTRGDDIIGKAFKGSLSEFVFFAMKKDGFLPPIQYFSRPSSGEFEARSEKLGREVLASPNINVSLKSKSTIRLNPYTGKFPGGAKEDLPGYSMEYQSFNGTDTLITCIVVIKDDQRLHVVYTQARQTSLPKCADELKALARSSYLIK